jgi:hypothetical protein
VRSFEMHPTQVSDDTGFEPIVELLADVVYTNQNNIYESKI